MALRSGLVRQPVSDPPPRYLVELAGGTDSTLAGVQALAQRARKAAAEVTESGTPVRVLRVVFVPEDGSRFLLYEAESEHAVGRAIARAEVAVQRVTRSLAPTDLPADGPAVPAPRK